MATEGWRAAAEVDGHVENGAMRHADELSLGLRDLVMDATEYVAA